MESRKDKMHMMMCTTIRCTEQEQTQGEANQREEREEIKAHHISLMLAAARRALPGAPSMADWSI